MGARWPTLCGLSWCFNPEKKKIRSNERMLNRRGFSFEPIV